MSKKEKTLNVKEGDLFYIGDKTYLVVIREEKILDLKRDEIVLKLITSGEEVKFSHLTKAV